MRRGMGRGNGTSLRIARWFSSRSHPARAHCTAAHFPESTGGISMSLASLLFLSILLHGTVVDPVQLRVAGAKVTAIPQGRGAGTSTLSDSNGEFSFTLPPGRYTVRIAAPGFSEFEETIELAETGPLQHTFSLQVAGINESVTVTESSDYQTSTINSATKTYTPLRDIPQAITVVTQQQVHDQLMQNVGDVVRYIPGITAHQGENNRDQVIIRGNNSSADFFVNGVRDDVPYFRDLYNVDRVEALKGPNAVMFGRGGGGGVINRVTKDAGFVAGRELTLVGGSYNDKRATADVDQPFSDRAAVRVNGVYEDAGSFRTAVNLRRYGLNPTVTIAPGPRTRVMFGY